MIDLISIPKSLRWYAGEGFEEDTWSYSVEVLLEQMLGVDQLIRTPFHHLVLIPTPCLKMLKILQLLYKTTIS